MTNIDWDNEAEVYEFARQSLLLANKPHEGIEYGPFEYSERYIQWERKFLADPFGYAKKKSRPMWRKMLQTAAMIVLAVAVTLGTLLWVNPTVRAAVIRWFTETFITHDAYRFTDDTPAEQTGSRWYPGYLPEGYVEVEYSNLFGYVSITFENEAGKKIFFDYQSTEEGGAFQVDNEQMEVTNTLIGNNIAVCYQSAVNSKPNAVILIDDGRNISFLVMGFEPCEALVQIAESIKMN